MACQHAEKSRGLPDVAIVDVDDFGVLSRWSQMMVSIRFSSPTRILSLDLVGRYSSM